jgi:carbamoyl-phosphate synthase large subunit
MNFNCHAVRAGFALEEIHRLTHIDPWFLQDIKEIVEMEDQLVKAGKLEALV